VENIRIVLLTRRVTAVVEPHEAVVIFDDIDVHPCIVLLATIHMQQGVYLVDGEPSRGGDTRVAAAYVVYHHAVFICAAAIQLLQSTSNVAVNATKTIAKKDFGIRIPLVKGREVREHGKLRNVRP